MYEDRSTEMFKLVSQMGDAEDKRTIEAAIEEIYNKVNHKDRQPKQAQRTNSKLNNLYKHQKKQTVKTRVK